MKSLFLILPLLLVVVSPSLAQNSIPLQQSEFQISLEIKLGKIPEPPQDNRGSGRRG